MDRATIVVHGGAGTITRAALSPAREAAFRGALAAILSTGAASLARGGSALDVAEEAVRAFEDCDLFNCGHGSVFTAAGTHELDAAVMTSAGAAGAVAGTTLITHPISAARAVMESGKIVMLAGSGADAFAASCGLEMVADNGVFSTPWRREQLEAALRAGSATVLDHSSEALVVDAAATPSSPLAEGTKFGTVGAVVLDAYGLLVAATSTGGMTGKVCGRVGDSPVVGAGTFASPRVAISCTGTGEAFIRICAGKDLDARMEFGGARLSAAAEGVIEKLTRVGGEGGLIALSADGEVSMPFNSEGMYRGVARAAGGAPDVFIYRDA